jgi:hypothetical protein
MSRKMMVCLSAGLLGLCLIAQPARADREYWVHDQGWFYGLALTPDGLMWQESSPQGATYYFEEIDRTPDHVELLDHSRNVYVLIYATELHVWNPNEGRWELYYRGHWEW